MEKNKDKKRIDKLEDRKNIFKRIYSWFSKQDQSRDLIQSEPKVVPADPISLRQTGAAGTGLSTAYHDFIYGTHLKKMSSKARVAEYLNMSFDPEVNYALTEIVDEICMEDSDGKLFMLKFGSKLKPEAKKILQHEFKELIINRLRLNEYNNIWDWTYKWLSQGIIMFKLNFSDDIATGVDSIEEIQPWLCAIMKDEEDAKEYYVIKDNEDDEEGYKHEQTEILQVDSGHYYDGEYFSILEFAKKDWRRLNLIEDATVIYKLSRSPLRRIFKVFVGKMPPKDIEQFLDDFKLRMAEDITYDAERGEVVGLNPITILDDFFFPVLEGGQDSCSVDLLEERSTGFDTQDELRYFLGKLYRSMKIPVGRMNIPDANGESTIMTSGSRMGEITRDEVKFAKFIKRLQNRFIENFIQELFFRHLFFRGLIDKLNVSKRDVEVNFIYTNPFSELKDQELIDTRIGNFSSLTGVVDGLSWRFLAKKYLKWNDDDFVENDKLFKEEIAKSYGMTTMGPEGGMGGLQGGAVPPGGMEGGLPGEDLGAGLEGEGTLSETPPPGTMGEVPPAGGGEGGIV